MVKHGLNPAKPVKRAGAAGRSCRHCRCAEVMWSAQTGRTRDKGRRRGDVTLEVTAGLRLVTSTWDG